MLICKRIKRAEIDAIDSSTSYQFLFEPAFPRLFLILKLLPNSTAESALEEVAVNLKTKSTLNKPVRSLLSPRKSSCSGFSWTTELLNYWTPVFFLFTSSESLSCLLPLASRPFLSAESFCPAALGIELNRILYAWPPLPQHSKCWLRQGRRSVPQWRIWKEPPNPGFSKHRLYFTAAAKPFLLIQDKTN